MFLKVAFWDQHYAILSHLTYLSYLRVAKNLFSTDDTGLSAKKRNLLVICSGLQKSLDIFSSSLQKWKISTHVFKSALFSHNPKVFHLKPSSGHFVIMRGVPIKCSEVSRTNAIGKSTFKTHNWGILQEICSVLSLEICRRFFSYIFLSSRHSS